MDSRPTRSVAHELSPELSSQLSLEVSPQFSSKLKVLAYIRPPNPAKVKRFAARRTFKNRKTAKNQAKLPPKYKALFAASESIPVDKLPEDTVFAGTLNVQGYLEVRVEKESEDSTFSRIPHNTQNTIPILNYRSTRSNKYFPLGYATVPWVSL